MDRTGTDVNFPLLDLIRYLALLFFFQITKFYFVWYRFFFVLFTDPALYITHHCLLCINSFLLLTFIFYLYFSLFLPIWELNNLQIDTVTVREVSHKGRALQVRHGSWTFFESFRLWNSLKLFFGFIKGF